MVGLICPPRVNWSAENWGAIGTPGTPGSGIPALYYIHIPLMRTLPKYIMEVKSS